MIDWSSNEKILVGLKNKVYMHNPLTNESELFCKYSEQSSTPEISFIKWMPDGNEYVAISLVNDQHVYIWSTVTQKVLRRCLYDEAEITTVDWNGKMLTTGNNKGYVHNHDISMKDSMVLEFNANKVKGSKSMLRGLDWDYSGRYLATGTYDTRRYDNKSVLKLFDLRRLDSNKYSENPRKVSFREIQTK